MQFTCVHGLIKTLFWVQLHSPAKCIYFLIMITIIIILLNK